LGFQHYGRSEDASEAEGFRIVGRNSDLWQVHAVYGCRMQIDPDVTFGNDLAKKNICQTGAKRSRLRTGKAAVQVSAVWQISGVVQKPISVDDRHAYQCPTKRAQVLDSQKPANNFNPDDLVTVNSGTDKDRRARLSPMDDVCGHRDRRVVGQNTDRQVDCLTASGIDRRVTKKERQARWH